MFTYIYIVFKFQFYPNEMKNISFFKIIIYNDVLPVRSKAILLWTRVSRPPIVAPSDGVVHSVEYLSSCSEGRSLRKVYRTVRHCTPSFSVVSWRTFSTRHGTQCALSYALFAHELGSSFRVWSLPCAFLKKNSIC